MCPPLLTVVKCSRQKMARVKLSKIKLPRNELIYTVLHLSLWAQIGVIVRAYLQKFFVLGCQGGWGPCLKGMDIVV